MERFGGSGEPLVVVDYAHSPDALANALAALRPVAVARGGRLAVVFGCGGDRDRGKRPVMGAIADSRADAVVITSDNPRSEDAAAIIAEIRAGAPGAARRLLAYPWPGNVRELQNCVERAVALARGDTLTEDDLPPRIRDHEAADVLVAAHDPSELVTLEEVERRYIRRVMEAVGGSKSEAARVLGLDRSTLYRKLDRYGVRGPRAASDD